MSASEDVPRDPLADLRPPEDDLAFRDELTGLYNRRLLSRMLDDEWPNVTQRTSRIAIVMLDMDLFKDVNDRYGHLSGDEVLRVTGRVLRTHFRKGDLLFRYGGDEFAALLPGAARDEADALAVRAHAALENSEFFTPSERERIDVPVGFSIGTASWPDDAADGHALLARADEFLYVEKSRRRLERTRSRRIALLIAATLLAVLLGVTTIAIRKGVEQQPMAAPATVARSRAELTERRELLRQITTLRKQIDSLVEARSSETEPAEADDRDREIAALELQVQELATRLSEREQVPAPAQQEPAPELVPETPLEPRTAVGPPPVAAESASPAPLQPLPRGITTTQPRLRREIRPEYPAMARKLGREATVDLRVLVDESGRVVRARAIGKRLGFGFEEAAIEAAMASEWIAATRNGAPIESEAILKVTFRMENR